MLLPGVVLTLLSQYYQHTFSLTYPIYPIKHLLLIHLDAFVSLDPNHPVQKYLVHHPI